MTGLATSAEPVRRRIRVSGVVQGVGFRPFVHRLATELDLVGQVGNDSDGVLVEVEGEERAVADFEARLVCESPPLARITGISAQTSVAVQRERAFRIVDSRASAGGRTYVSPDVAVCDDCLAEMWDPGNRRYRYPFINCTNCGPRFTITIGLPYDRPNTTMSGFDLCPECSQEYHDPRDRRFHAQPVACDACGPRLWFECRRGTVPGSDRALAAAQAVLAAGGIVAVKGIGGYHLACDATSDAAVATLRERKHRPDKPLAVMVPDIATAATLAEVDESAAEILAGPARPIVLLRRRAAAHLIPQVAPGNPHIGVMLPYTPLHHLLLSGPPGARGASVGAPRVLVMTSGNLSDEPICYDDGEARRRLGAIADAWLVHDRPIHVPCDDSVVRVASGRELPVRRSRGHAPLPIRLPFDARAVLAVGAELKNTFCLASGREAWMSQHIGDMGSVETLSAFERSTQQFARIYGVRPERVAADTHPGYQTRRWADECGLPLTPVQHHHAHIAAVMVEHGVEAGERVIGCAFDGTGYGPDGAIWGGEVLIAGYGSFERAAHLRYVPLPGGDATIRKPSRAALAHLWAAGMEWDPDLPPVAVASATERAVLRRQLERGVGCVPTSSMGRLWDAVSSLIGLRHTVSYEAQAAIELEAIAAEAQAAGAGSYRFAVAAGEIDPRPVLRAIVEDLRSGRSRAAIAAGFHLAVADLIAGTAEALSRTSGLNRVALSGGVFQNVLLCDLVRARLGGSGLELLTHQAVPPNDGGLALGQAAVAGFTGEA